MTNTAQQLQSAAVLVAILVAVAGLVLVGLRADLTGGARWARAAFAAGFAVAGLSAVVHCALLLSDGTRSSPPIVSVLRLVGAGFMAIGGAGWGAGRQARLVLWSGSALIAAAAVTVLAGVSGSVANVALVAGNIVVAGSWVTGTRHPIVATAEVPAPVSADARSEPDGEMVGGGMRRAHDVRQEQEFERLKSAFLGRVGHEMRTPLTAIMGYSEILIGRTVSDAQAKVWHQEILLSAKRLARTIELLEFFASTSEGLVLLDPEPQDVGMLVSDVATAWVQHMSERHALVQRVAESTPAVRADRRWLLAALNELMDNAVKFSPRGGRILLAAGPSPGDPVGGVDITIDDRGMGMSDEQATAAFGEFGGNDDDAAIPCFGGPGLGLALVRRVVAGHGGSVLCESSPGRGSRLTIRLPAPVTSHNGMGKGPDSAERPSVGGVG
jgi:signal transduction histidine kinase